ncbi:MAG: amidohydrolase [Acidobacteriota bacterium]|jgi:predicted amidohydrolase YtcJ
MTMHRHAPSPLSRRLLVCGVLLLFALASACGPASDVEPADMVVYNGKVVTVDDNVPEAEGIVINDGRIELVGSNAEVEPYIGEDTELIDLDGALAIPGFIEGHGHFMGIGSNVMNLDLLDVTSWQEVVDMVAAAVADAEPGQLIEGRGWHQEKMTDLDESNTVRGFPTHDAVSAVSRENPVILRHASGHASFGNAYAMELAGVTKDTAQPDGGEIIMGPDGEPIGVFVERASSVLGQATRNIENRMTDEDRAARSWRQMELASQEVISKGITSFQDAGSGIDTIDMFKRGVDEGALQVRMWVMLRGGAMDAETLQAQRVIGYGDDMLTVRAIKMAIDGALGPRGAWLLEPYADEPSSSGHNTGDPVLIEEIANRALENGYQLCVHAIGDRANREVLDIYERAFAAHPEEADDARFRIEHAQHLHPDDIPRFGQLGVIASMQGIHCTSDAPWVTPRLGPERAEWGAYVWQDLMRSGAVVTNGTDAPVERVDPIPSFYASVSRMMADGEPFYPEQRMSRMEALRSYTINTAFAAFEEDIKGSITPGKLADITILDRDIMTIPEEEILDTEVVFTIIGGKVVYNRGGDRVIVP